MASQLELLEEAERRGLLSGEKKALLDEARRRNILVTRPPDPGARKGIEGDLRPGLAGMANAATAGTDPLNRILSGMMDIPLAGAQLGLNAASAVGIGEETARDFDQYLAQREREYQVGRTPEFAPAYIEQYMSGEASMPDNRPFDWARTAGNVVASLPLGVAGGETMTGALLSGGAMGALTPQTGGEFSWEDKALQTGLGAAGAAGGNIVGRGLSSAIRPNVSPEVQALLSKGVTPTPGQILGGGWNATEQKLTSIWGLGDAISSGRQAVNREFNQAVYRDVLRPISGNLPLGVGRAAIDDIHQQVSRAYDDILGKMTFTADNQFFADLSARLQPLTSEMPPDTAAQFMRLMRDRVTAALGTGGTMTGRSFKDLDSALGNSASRLMSSPDAYQRIYGEAVTELRNILRDAMARTNQGVTVNIGSNTVDAGQRLADINQSFANLVRLERAAAGAGAAEGVFTPAQFLSAVRQSDRSSRKNAYARGEALMQDLGEAGKSVLGSTVPDSGTPGRLAAVGTGAALALNPALALPGLLAASAYTNPGRRLVGGLLTSRPAIADPIAKRTLDMMPGLLAGGAALTTPTTP